MRPRPARRWAERAFWNVQSLTWDDVLQKPRHREKLRQVLGLLGELGAPGDRLLDLGCGTGAYSVPLASAGFEVVGLDFSPAMLRRAAAKAAAGSPGSTLQFDQADFNRPLGYHDGSFHHVLSVCSLHCVREPLALFREVRRVLRPQGWFVLVALSGQRTGEPGLALGTSLARRAFWGVKRRMARGTRWARYPRAQLVAMLRDTGFDVDRRIERAQILAVPAGAG